MSDFRHDGERGCGLARIRPKGHRGAQGPYVSELTPEKEAAPRGAFIRFGLIKMNKLKGERPHGSGRSPCCVQ